MKLPLSVFFLLISNSLLAQNNPIAGKWLTIDNDDTIVIELTKDKVFYLISLTDNDTVGGLNKYSEYDSYIDSHNYYEDSVFLDCKYTYDLGVFPHRLILTAYYAGTDSFKFIIPSIFEFKENNSISIVAKSAHITNGINKNPDKELKEFFASVKLNERVNKRFFKVYTLNPLK